MKADIKYGMVGVALLITSALTIAEDSQEDLSIDNFQVKWKPNSIIPSLNVTSQHPSQIIYNSSNSAQLPFQVEVRGRCPSASSKLTAFRLRIGNQTILEIPVSGNNRSLTGNNGNAWETHNINVNFPVDNLNAINACRALANEKLQTQSHDQVFNENFVTNSFGSNIDVESWYWCEGGVGFHEPIYDTTELPVSAICEATGYRSTLWMTESTINLTPTTTQAGACQLNIQGGFSTSYELYSLRSNNSTANLQYRFRFNGSNSNVAYSDWTNVTANPINGGTFSFNYTDRLPSNINGGTITLEMRSLGDNYESAPKPFNIDCVDQAPLQTPQTLSLNLTVEADTSETIAVGNQICPTHATVTGFVNAGYPINGSMIIVGQSIADVYTQAISLDAADRVQQIKRVPLTWTNAAGTLSIGINNAPNNQLRKQSLNYGLNVTNSQNQLVKSLAKKDFEVSCQLPTFNPNLPGSTTVTMTPNHTGGGGNPTGIQGNQSRLPSPPAPARNAGLRSDGELVQAVSDNATNRNTQTQPRVVAPIKPISPLTPPTAPNTRPAPNQGIQPISPPNAANQRQNVKDSHDRMANMETSAMPNTRGVGSQSRPTLYQGNIGDRCNARSVPGVQTYPNLVLKRGVVQVYVECKNNRITEVRGRSVNPQWKQGDPVQAKSR